MDQVIEYMTVGAIGAGYAVAGLFFLRFWSETRDRLFILFALSFFILTVNRVTVALFAPGGEEAGPFYWVRLAAFGLILLAIVDKNRPRRSLVARPAGSVSRTG